MQMNLDKTLLRFEEKKLNIKRNFFCIQQCLQNSGLLFPAYLIVVIFYTIAIFGREILHLNVNSQQKLPRHKTVCKILHAV